MMKVDIRKHKNGMFYCQLTDEEYPYGSALGWGKDEVEAEMNAWSLRKQILEKQLSTSPTMAIPMDTYEEVKLSRSTPPATAELAEMKGEE